MSTRMRRARARGRAAAKAFTLTLLSCSHSSYAEHGHALAAARALDAPQILVEKGGEYEGIDFWEKHDELLTQAWAELGPNVSELYTYGTAFDQLYIADPLRKAAAAARSGKGETMARALFDEILPGVYRSDRIFTKQFLDDLQTELDHIQSSGIPQRRPNGMNRYGVILDQVGLDEAMKGFVSAYVRPLATMLFPELIGKGDAAEQYAFTVKYEPSGDTELAKHGDASVATLNLCLARRREAGKEANTGKLRFFDSGGYGYFKLPAGNASSGAGDVDFEPGVVVLHRGQHKHQALPLVDGERLNLVIWLMGDGGYVRVAPYPSDQQLSVQERWSLPTTQARSSEL